MKELKMILPVMAWMLLVSAIATGIVWALYNGYALHFAWTWMTIIFLGLLWTRKFFH